MFLHSDNEEEESRLATRRSSVPLPARTRAAALQVAEWAPSGAGLLGDLLGGGGHGVRDQARDLPRLHHPRDGAELVGPRAPGAAAPRRGQQLPRRDARHRERDRGEAALRLPHPLRAAPPLRRPG